MVDVPHLKWPLRLDGSSLVTVEQDSADDIAQCVTLIVATGRGTRLELPDFGIDDPTFTRDLNNAEVESQILEWEPRAVSSSDAGRVDASLTATLTVRVDG